MYCSSCSSSICSVGKILNTGAPLFSGSFTKQGALPFRAFSQRSAEGLRSAYRYSGCSVSNRSFSPRNRARFCRRQAASSSRPVREYFGVSNSFGEIPSMPSAS